MFGLNIFSVGRYVETTTILWLRYVSLIVVAIGMSLVYAAGTSSPPNNILRILGWLISSLGLIALILYLLYGYYYIPKIDGSCIYCPSEPIRVLMNGNPSTTRSIVPLPPKDPFRHTLVYYLRIDKIKPIPSTTACSLIEKKDLYKIVMDGTTGELGISELPENVVGKPVTFFGNLPQQSLVQLAIVHEEKEIRVFVNGIPRGAMIRKNLPPTSSMNSSTVFNGDKCIQSGIVYQVESYEGNLSPAEMYQRYEAMTIKYENDSTYQNTNFPTENTEIQMTLSQRFIGMMKLFGGMLGYSTGVTTATGDIQASQ